MVKKNFQLTLSVFFAASFIFSFLFTNASPVEASSCLVFSNNLSIGTSSNDVSALQAYLQSKGYLNHAPTGYFGSLTLTAVEALQKANGIEATGFVGPLTRAFLASASCSSSGSSSNVQGCTATSLYSTLTGQRCVNANTPTLSYISPTSAQAGTPVIIYGTGFLSSGNTIRFGNYTLANAASYDGQTLSFTMPSYVSPYCAPGTACPALAMLLSSGNYEVTITNTNGTSNYLNFTFISSTPCHSNCAVASGPTISTINPTNVAVGSNVTLKGSGFTSTGNSVEINNGILVNNIPSSDGSTLSFSVPYAYSGQLQCHGATCSSITTNLLIGTYPLVVVNTNGTSNAVELNITSTQNASYIPSINSVSGPSTLSVGQTGTWIVSATDPENSTLFYNATWGDVEPNQCPSGYLPQPDGYGGYTCQYAPNGLANIQLNGSFTHSYSQSGTYSITFNVSNLGSYKTSRSTTVNVVAN